MSRPESGFTLIELLIVIAIIGVIASVAVPSLISAKPAANETQAVAALRLIVNAQNQFKSAAVLDGDSDGEPEYGSFGELAGVMPLDARGQGVPRRLEPPVLSGVFQQIAADGTVSKGGYRYRIYLGVRIGGAESESGGLLPAGLDVNSNELHWCAYAWPEGVGDTGSRAYFISERGEILFSFGGYEGARGPLWQAAYPRGAQGLEDGAGPGVGSDGTVWTAL